MKIQGDSRKQRIQFQLDNWVLGNSIHNDVDDECCPDFSCCNPGSLQPTEVRKTFAKANDEQRQSMLFSFLGAEIASYVPDKKVFIANGKDEITSIKN